MQVGIFGQVYNVRGEDDQGYIEELAHFVDAKMKAISEKTGTIDSLKVAILAALNITDEFFKLEREREEYEKRMATRAGELTEALDEALAEELQSAVEPKGASS